MARKRRFGIAVDTTLAEKLDLVARSMNIDRSKLVEKMLSEYIEDYMHNVKDHQCCGVVVAESEKCEYISRSAQLYRDIIVSYTHNHVQEKCVCTFLIIGDSKRVRNFHKELVLNNVKAKYVPVAHT